MIGNYGKWERWLDRKIRKNSLDFDGKEGGKKELLAGNGQGETLSLAVKGREKTTDRNLPSVDPHSHSS